MKKLYFSLSLCLFLGGCAFASSAYLPDGSQGHNISCSGRESSWGACYQKAGEICGARGYQTIEKSGDSSSGLSGNQFGLYGGTYNSRNMLIKCK